MLEQRTAVRQEPFHNSKMPVNALQALPSYLLERWGWDKPLTMAGREIPYGEYRWWLARGVTVAFGLLLLGVVALWSWQINGPAGALCSVGLAALCPTILGHAHYVTTDVPAAAMMLLAMYAFWRFCRHPGATSFFASALALGLAQLTKYTAGILLGFYAFAGVATAIGHGWIWVRQRWALLSAIVLGFLLLTLGIVNTGFLWEQPMASPNTYGQSGDRQLNMIPGDLRDTKLPTAYGWYQGLALTIGFERNLEQSPGRPYMLGVAEYRRWLGYYPLALLLKMPLAFWGLLALAVLRRKYSQDEIVFLIVPAAGMFLYFTFFQRLQLGIRFLMPMLPFLYVFAGRIFKPGGGKPDKASRIIAVSLMAWFAISSLSYHPHPVSYFNELIGSRVNAYRYLVDSNLDWGQNQRQLQRYLHEHASEGIVVNPPGPATGKIIVGANHFAGIYDPEQYRWLREHHRPVGHVAYSWLLFDIAQKKVVPSQDL